MGFQKVVLSLSDCAETVVAKTNKDTTIMFEQIKDILRGKINNWNQISKAFKKRQIKLVFDHSSSSNVRYMKEISNIEKFPTYAYAKNDSKSVIDYVSNNNDAIGIIGVNRISDKDNPGSLNFLKTITPMDIAPADTSVGAGDYYKPYQAYIAQKFYPLIRNIYAITRESKSGLGSGFMTYMASQPGQRIIKMEGLLPARASIRVVNIKNEKINIVK